MWIFLAIVFLGLGGLVYWLWAKHKRREELLSMPLTPQERAIVAKLVPLTCKLPDHLRPAFEGKINLFLDQVTFYGGNGLQVTEEMEFSIAAQASLLVVNSDSWYKTLRTVLIYPGAFKSHQKSVSDHVVTQHKSVRLGESWLRGPVVLSWPHTEQGGVNPEDGHNVALHEFAHQIDALSGATNGVPILNRSQSFARWERVFLSAYDRLVRNAQRGRKTVLDHYGAEANEELFAVAIEVFFEKPHQLLRDEPEIYQELSELLQLDPVNWTG